MNFLPKLIFSAMVTVALSTGLTSCSDQKNSKPGSSNIGGDKKPQTQIVADPCCKTTCDNGSCTAYGENCTCTCVSGNPRCSSGAGGGVVVNLNNNIDSLNNDLIDDVVSGWNASYKQTVINSLDSIGLVANKAGYKLNSKKDPELYDAYARNVDSLDKIFTNQISDNHRTAYFDYINNY